MNDGAIPRMVFPLIGCAGWNVPAAVHEQFPEEGSHLQRYAGVFPAVEINTCFYRPHRPATYAKWRDSVPEDFRFAAKIPKEITHELQLRNADSPLRKFIHEVSHLEHKLGCLLVQVPPRLPFDARSARHFFHALRDLTAVDVVCEPRHVSWFAPDAAEILKETGISYVIADPPVAAVPEVATTGTLYVRLHGSPVMYYSEYSEPYLDRLAVKIERRVHAGTRVWCVFDNTASGAAVPNALSLLNRFPLAASAVPYRPTQMYMAPSRKEKITR